MYRTNLREWRFTTDTQTDIVTSELRQRILDGEFGTGGRLPPVRMLAKEYKVGPDLVNKVMQRLQAEGLLIARGRAGMFVNKPRPRIPSNLALFHIFLENQGLEAIEETLEGPSIVSAPEHAVRSMGIDESVPVISRLRRLGTSKVHYCLLEAFYPTTLVDEKLIENMREEKNFNIVEYIKENKGISAREVHEDVVGRLPTAKEQELLDIVAGTPVQEVNSTYYAEDGKTVVLYMHSILVASYFVLSYDYAVPSF